MNKKGLVAIICVITVAVFAVVTFLFINIMKKPNDEPVQTPDTDTQSGQQTQEPDNVTDEPVNTTDDTSNTTDDTSSTTGNDESEQTNDVPDESEQGNQNTPSVSTTIPTSYKEFSLTSGKSASEAYTYLTEFLNSKYSILVNKENKVASDYEPTDLKTPSGSDYKLEAKAAAALEQMMSDAKKDGIYDLQFYSGYRTYASQKNKYETRIQRYLNEGYSQQAAEEKAGEYIAPPGSSEHHTGLAADVCSYAIVSKYGYLSDEFDTTKEWRWLNEHCSEYGFILRYKKEAEDITGFLYEPWHFRYIGVEHAKACTELGITYEEYHEMLVKFQNEAKAEA